MNKQRRAHLATEIVCLEFFIARLNIASEAEQNAYDAMPESVRHTARGEASADAANAIESAVDCVQDAIDHLNEAIL